jgi:hypothetical protein
MHRRPNRLLIGFLVSALAVGMPYWVTPYGRLTLPDALMGPGLLVVGLAACLLRSHGAARFWKVTLVPASSVPAVVLSRVLADGLRDPTSHNLWPLEFLIATGVGIVSALVGAVAGSVIAHCTRARSKRR